MSGTEITGIDFEEEEGGILPAPRPHTTGFFDYSLIQLIDTYKVLYKKKVSPTS